MSNVIQFLETMGRKPLTAGEYAAIISMLDVGNGERQALLDRDHATLNDLLGGRPKMICFVVAPDEEEAPARPEDEPQKAPDEPQPNE